jgi:tetrahydromethanopterin S-methyltransferase subunit A
MTERLMYQVIHNVLSNPNATAMSILGHKGVDHETGLCCFALQKDHANGKNHDGVTAADGVSSLL